MFLLIEQNQVTLRDEPLSLELMQQLVGDPTERAYVEYVRECFSDPTIDLVCDEEYAFKTMILGSLDFSCKIGQVSLCGNVLAVAVNDEGETIGLTDEQIAIVLAELLVVREIRDRLLYVPAKSVCQMSLTV